MQFFITCILIFLFVLSNFCVQATPNVSILVGDRHTGSYQFAQELSRLWDTPVFRTNNSLIPVTEKFVQTRIERLRLRQGDLAIIDPQNAHQLLPKNPEIAAVSVLWPNILYIIGLPSKTRPLGIQSTTPIHIHQNSDYFVATWSKLLSLKNYNAAQFNWFTANEGQSILSKLNKDLLIVTAPYPIQELDLFFKKNPSYRLIPLSDELLASNRQHYPWIIDRSLPANVYPVVGAEPLRLLTSFPVLVSRTDAPKAFIQKLLEILFSQSSSIEPHTLFRFLDPQHNQLFEKNYPFHKISKKFFKL
ncbi:MAG: hypothetical protein HQM14_08955 [SAR324 cluster bacterium]|nr:hypothetical protein [SAR324 cluster bacterium]